MVDYSSSGSDSPPLPPAFLPAKPKSKAVPQLTQQQFLDSLRPIAVDSLDENDKKCGYCWRNYGEPNPGLDDAEEPVQFSCKHVFGEQCMRSLFAIREPARVALKPLSFEPGSKGEDLGNRLSTYIHEQSVPGSALLRGGNPQKDFVRLLMEALPPERPAEFNKAGCSLLGKYWYSIYYDIVQALTTTPKEIHLLENAVVFDIKLSKSQGTPAGLKPGCDAHKKHDFQEYSAFGNLDALVSLPPITSVPQDLDHLLKAELPPMHFTESTVSHSSTSKAPGNTEANKPLLLWQQEAKMLGASQIEDEQKYWKDVLETHSKLDSLIAKHKEVEAKKEEAKKQLKAEESKKQVIPPGLHYLHSSMNISSKAVSGPPPKVQPVDPFDIVKPEDALIPGFQAQKQKLALEQQRAKAAKLAKEREKRHKHIIERLAEVFTEIYANFENYQYEAALAAGHPPPVKKLRLTDKKPYLLDDIQPTYTMAPLSPQDPVDPKAAGSSKSLDIPHWCVPDFSEILTRPRTISLSVELCNRSKDAKSIRVSPPTLSVLDDETDVDDEFGEESDGVVDAERAATFFADKVILLYRKMCPWCFKGGPSSNFMCVPEEVWWKVSSRGPDDCPRCRRVLFKQE